MRMYFESAAFLMRDVRSGSSKYHEPRVIAKAISEVTDF